jgi:hypothetical protein
MLKSSKKTLFSKNEVLVKENEASFDLHGQLIGLSDPAHHPKNPV